MHLRPMVPKQHAYFVVGTKLKVQTEILKCIDWYRKGYEMQILDYFVL